MKRRGRPSADLDLTPHSEIAAELHISEATVKRDLSSATAKVKLAVEEYGRIRFGDLRRRCNCGECPGNAETKLLSYVNGNPETVAQIDAWKFEAQGSLMSAEQLDQLFAPRLEFDLCEMRSSIGKNTTSECPEENPDGN